VVHVVAVEGRGRKEEVGRTDAVIMGSTMPDDRKDLDKEENEENFNRGAGQDFAKIGDIGGSAKRI
tara:strand:- start:209 stop:406 length:198 start_codon:yes stop_codon:yes gene_type:complete